MLFAATCVLCHACCCTFQGFLLSRCISITGIDDAFFCGGLRLREVTRNAVTVISLLKRAPSDDGTYWLNWSCMYLVYHSRYLVPGIKNIYQVDQYSSGICWCATSLCDIATGLCNFVFPTGDHPIYGHIFTAPECLPDRYVKLFP